MSGPPDYNVDLNNDEGMRALSTIMLSSGAGPPGVKSPSSRLMVSLQNLSCCLIALDGVHI
jgi:hypothetical protein